MTNDAQRFGRGGLRVASLSLPWALCGLVAVGALPSSCARAGDSAATATDDASVSADAGSQPASAAEGAVTTPSSGSGAVAIEDRVAAPQVVCAGVVCQYDMVCALGPTGEFCRCADGFTQHSPESRCVDIDECQIENICPNATCENKEGAYICTCKAGYVPGANNRCDDIDECALGTHRCDPAKPCENTKGAYTCGGMAVEPDGATDPTAPVPGWILAISEGSAAPVDDGSGPSVSQ